MRSDGGENAAEKIIQRPRAHARFEICPGDFLRFSPRFRFVPLRFTRRSPFELQAKPLETAAVSF